MHVSQLAHPSTCPTGALGSFRRWKAVLRTYEKAKARQAQLTLCVECDAGFVPFQHVPVQPWTAFSLSDGAQLPKKRFACSSIASLGRDVQILQKERGL